MLVICESAYRNCVVIVHQRLGAFITRWSALGHFPEVTLKRRPGAHICLVSAYLPHTRSLLGSWTDELLKWESQAKEVRRRDARLVCGGDFNQDKIAASLSRSVPRGPVADAEAELGHGEAFMGAIYRESLSVVMPQGGIQDTHQPYAAD